MSRLVVAVRVEALKTRRSRVPVATAAAFAFAALVGGLFMFVLQDQRRARSLGLLGAKATLAGAEADWPGYFAMLAQTAAVGGTVLFGLVVVWLFGREFSQGTVKDLLALPTSRTTIVVAKFVVAAGWCLLLTVQLAVLGLAVGAVLGLPGWNAGIALTALLRLLAVAGMTVAVMSPVALAASAGRGYLSGIAAVIATVFLAQVVAALGHGHHFPWSVPALFSGVAGPDRAMPGAIGFGLVALVGIGGVLGTAWWWRDADQDR
ncbi:ABC transporter permease [Saccharothrix variisporea]|uniref:ABC-2 type transport system permease protein n=1 Tax=Saccharothrix variisporea TaxID=543527 RepID=A0A495X5X0_9PSEU|nr:ABC transporter permease [Saccharothrix variisporea]RKT69277.1 ABC-2 type transport system permease protein [Saccharothrix variisporea]